MRDKGSERQETAAFGGCLSDSPSVGGLLPRFPFLEKPGLPTFSFPSRLCSVSFLFLRSPVTSAGGDGDGCLRLRCSSLRSGVASCLEMSPWKKKKTRRREPNHCASSVNRQVYLRRIGVPVSCVPPGARLFKSPAPAAGVSIRQLTGPGKTQTSQSSRLLCSCRRLQVVDNTETLLPCSPGGVLLLFTPRFACLAGKGERKGGKGRYDPLRQCESNRRDKRSREAMHTSRWTGEYIGRYFVHYFHFLLPFHCHHRVLFFVTGALAIPLPPSLQRAFWAW